MIQCEFQSILASVFKSDFVGIGHWMAKYKAKSSFMCKNVNLSKMSVLLVKIEFGQILA